MAKIKAKLGNVEVGDGLPVVIIGAINLSSDSFYQGSIVKSSADATKKAREMIEEGASIIDVGAMGTGPSSKPISAKREFNALVPTIKALARELDAPISVDTQRAEIAKAAIEVGASVINDISGLKNDPRMATVLASSGCSTVLMAAKCTPGDTYGIGEIKRALNKSLEICREHGIRLKRVVLDPAIGYWPGRLKRLGRKALRQPAGKSYSQAAFFDLRILAKLSEFRELGQPICVGISRKSFIGSVLGLHDPSQRLVGSLAASAIAVLNGAHVLRTHDPAETLQAVKMAEAIRDAKKR
jgi:dihydropteroate synthase